MSGGRIGNLSSKKELNGIFHLTPYLKAFIGAALLAAAPAAELPLQPAVPPDRAV